MLTANNLLSKYRKFEERFIHSLSSSKRTQYFRRKCLLRWQKRLAALGIFVGVVALPGKAQINIIRQGLEDKLNTTIVGEQNYCNVELNDHGQCIVVWEDINASVSRFQRFQWNEESDDMEKVGNEEILANNAEYPDVTLNEEGDIIFIWSTENNNIDQTFIKRYQWGNDNNLITIDQNALQVSDHDVFKNSKIALNDQKDIVVSWSTSNQFAPGSSADVFARRYHWEDDNSLDAIDEEPFLVSSPDNLVYDIYPCVVLNEEGDFVIVYSNTEGVNNNIYAQRYDFANTAQPQQGNLEKININDVGSVTYPKTALNEQGDLVFVWAKSNESIVLRKYTWVENNLTAIDNGEIVVNELEQEAYDLHVDVDMDRRGNFIVCWSDRGTYNSKAKVYNKFTDSLSDDYQLNTFSQGYQELPVVALNNEGDFMAVWRGYGEDKDGNVFFNNYEIFGQYFHIDGLPTATENPISRSVRLYPNPGEGVYQINWGQLAGKNIAVSVKDMLGKVQQESLFNSSDNTLDIKELPSGMYFVELLQGEHKVVKRVIKR